jgi:predicted DNA-binding transcriptional regulator AlpA
VPKRHSQFPTDLERFYQVIGDCQGYFGGLLTPQTLDFFVGTNAQDIMTIQQFITLKQLMFIANISESTAHRRLKESRNGVGGFPKPIDGFKRKLLFSPIEVERWMCSQQPHVPVAKVESETQRQRRHNMAIKALEKKGVKTTKTK